MPELRFQVEKAEPIRFAVAPMLGFRLLVHSDREDEEIHSITLRCQIRIEPTGRSYQPEEQTALVELFGTPERWGTTLKSMLWTHTSTVVTPFRGSTEVELPVPCSFDFNVAATKYFHGLQTGEVSLLLLFSGTIFYADEDGGLQITQIPWDKEVRFRLPVSVWQEMMDHYYPNTVWMAIPREVFESLSRHKVRHGFPTWEQALESVIPKKGDAG